MSRDKAKSSGWAAFDLKQRQKQGLEPQVDKDPYPPMTSSLATLHGCQNSRGFHDTSARSFLSVLRPSVECPTLTGNKDSEKPVEVGDSNGKRGIKVVEENNYDLVFKSLKELHSWADNSLIDDVMATVDDNADKASRLLEAMLFTESTEENKKTIISEQISTTGECNKKTDKNAQLGNYTDNHTLSPLEYGLRYSNNDLKEICASSGKTHATDMSVPVEPEWVEDDVYFTHRKDAIRMMRSASQLSRAASNAFLRGDRLSAQKYSLKAREEWLSAERLNAKAAEEILSIRNCNNGMWKLDLHGLHAAEAAEALREHLHKIETHIPIYRSISPNRVQTQNRILRSSSLESFSCIETEKLDKQQTTFRQQPTSLQVITGVGNHSRGEAALPAAVRNFLAENGYRFDEPRPGVFLVRPKFRRK
ncbi:Smr domain-containing protein/DUF1771 domain-containing protein [Cephalotus follicularis]|uniref:Smr domain-containing protein/DUF1771 domain-containing protein n=1 Tax=Cephalotus follicularis TaxID=3775 RepID=A0A1Q3BMN3_CEPFO|nr:Smr domain-containing protein/DUF1771 domain-containing protein [Cephalotus follicularis]